MFVGEAPGRLGADDSQLPFHGDKSGHNFESLIAQVGISRYEVFVTNAVLCNPKDERGNNSTPNSGEITNCMPFLKETIEILDPSIIVTLGAVALKACGELEGYSFSLREKVRTVNAWMGRKLIPVYHPGQRAMVHRSFANQLSDYQFVAENLRSLISLEKRLLTQDPGLTLLKSERWLNESCKLALLG
ncbi:uracil-DNA glycosylase [Achromobacter xylosoxidans]|uniref:uracil-DNA glycosylase n=1 Tax=Alcaligenes xylosoxydans xylosoxydans TaxID=85698 RepID=UPI002A765653|nr:uracil-DNA glycosylase [Achromobacter xylosoxidans]WPQ36580.1 uracil-DNA glycosylase [Achromobacter xylosoxidans]